MTNIIPHYMDIVLHTELVVLYIPNDKRHLRVDSVEHTQTDRDHTLSRTELMLNFYSKPIASPDLFYRLVLNSFDSI